MEVVVYLLSGCLTGLLELLICQTLQQIAHQFIDVDVGDSSRVVLVVYFEQPPSDVGISVDQVSQLVEQAGFAVDIRRVGQNPNVLIVSID